MCISAKSVNVDADADADADVSTCCQVNLYFCNIKHVSYKSAVIILIINKSAMQKKKPFFIGMKR